METYVLVQNPNAAATDVSLTFQTAEGEVAGLSETIPANSRRTYKVNDYVTTYDVSTMVNASAGVVAERSTYGNDMNWGTCSIGAATPATAWYLAEGSSAGGMETYILVQNPNGTPVTVTLTFQTGEGQVSGPSETIPANSRRTYKVNDFVTTFDVSTMVSASAGVVVERSMYGNDRTWATGSVGYTP
jgi:hypothetical protein